MKMLKYSKLLPALFALGGALASTSAQALFFVEQWSVSTTVTQLSANSWDYEFTVKNQSFAASLINQFAIPTFGDAGITAVHSPYGWSNASASSVGGRAVSNWASFAGVSNVLLWTDLSLTNPVPTGSQLSGFGFTSSFSPVKGPSIVLFSNGNGGVQDPGMPGSPLAAAAGFTTPFPVSAAAVPEPGTWALLSAGLLILGLKKRRHHIKR